MTLGMIVMSMEEPEWTHSVHMTQILDFQLEHY